MALEAGLQPLYQAGAQGLTKAENHRGRRRVVIEAIGAPVALELDEVEVVAADLRPAASEHRFGPGIVGDGSEPGGTGEAFLRPRHDDVGIPAVRGHLAAAQRDHGVGHEERVVGMGQARQLLERLEHARRGLAVNDGDHPCGTDLERLRNRLRLDHAPPLGANRHHGGAAALGDLDHQEAEAAALRDDHAVPGLEQGDNRRLEPRAARAGHGKGALVVRLEDGAQELHDLVHHRGELGIELAEKGRGHGAEHAGIRHGGTGSQQDARTRQEIARHVGHGDRV